MKIISLLPSATEIICALGLEDQLVAVTHECDFPASVQQLPKSNPGPRLVDSLEMLAHILHPETHPHPNGVPRPLRAGDAATATPKPLATASA